jgi:DnaJ like chaperone protein
MPWKALQTAVGLDKGGPLRNALGQIWQSLGVEGAPRHDCAQCRVAFTIGVITLAAKMSKADGVSSAIEAAAFERQFSVPESERENARRLFSLASEDVAGYETYASQMARILAGEPELKITVLECLFHIATADGILHPAEDGFLSTVSTLFGVSQNEYRAVRRAFIHDPDSPYEVLSIDAAATDQEIKARYRELVKSHHPDALVSKGVPPEFLAAASRRLASITGAYEAIQVERGLQRERALEPSS